MTSFVFFDNNNIAMKMRKSGRFTYLGKVHLNRDYWFKMEILLMV